MSDGEHVRSFRISLRGLFVGISLALFLIRLVLDCFDIDRPDPGTRHCTAAGRVAGDV